MSSIDVPKSEHEFSTVKDQAHAEASTRPSSEATTPPEKPVDIQIGELNWRSASVLMGTALSYFITVGFANAFGVFQQYYVAHLLVPKTNFQIAWIGSFATFMLFAFAAPAGFLGDKFGPTPLITIGVICELIAIFMLSLCKEYYQVFLAQGVLLGASFALIAIPATSIPPLYFRKNRALSQGVTIGGSSLGGVIWPIVLDQLLNKHKLGWGWTIRTVGFMLIPLSLIVILTVRRPRDTRSDAEKQLNKKLVVKRDYSVLRSLTAIMLFLGLASAFLGFFSPLYFVSTYAVSIGMSENFAFYLVSIANAASLFGRILPGYFADRYLGSFNLLICSCVLSAIVTFCWTTATSVAGVVVWIAAYGFASGAILSLQVVCASGLGSPEIAGAAIGVAMTSASLAGLFGSPIAGELVKQGYTALSCYAAAVLLFAGGCVTVARLSKDRRLLVKV